MRLRRVQMIIETIYEESGRSIDEPIVRAAAAAIVQNPCANRGFTEDLGELFDIGRNLGKQLTPELVRMLRRSPVSYGKAAIVGVGGEMEHGGACIHPKLGKPMRDAVGGGKALIASNCKIAGPGCPIDVPLGHKDEAWSYPHFDTMTIMVPDAPRPDEIVVVIAVADGGRPFPRVGDRPLVD